MKTTCLAILSTLVLLGLVQGATYHIICTDNSAGYCTTWDVNNAASCFPPNAKIMTRHGLTPMHQLKTGEEVLGMVYGQEVFTKITSWFDHSDKEVDYLAL